MSSNLGYINLYRNTMRETRACQNVSILIVMFSCTTVIKLQGDPQVTPLITQHFCLKFSWLLLACLFGCLLKRVFNLFCAFSLIESRYAPYFRILFYTVMIWKKHDVWAYLETMRIFRNYVKNMFYDSNCIFPAVRTESRICGRYFCIQILTHCFVFCVLQI